jgi:hypothetical protein
LVDNDNANYVADYVATDVNGDGVTDLSDLGICDNNNANYIAKVVPPGAPSMVKNAIRTVKSPVVKNNVTK